MFQKILVPLDGSEVAFRILTQARRLLLRSDREIMLVQVLPPTRGSHPDPDVLARVRGELDRIREGFAVHAVRASYRILTGDAAEQIHRFALEYAPDLIAISAKGQGVTRGARGRVAEEILRGSAVPVLLSNPLDYARNEELQFRRILVPLDGTDGSGAILPLVASVAHDYASEVILLHVVEVPRFNYPTVPVSIAERDAMPLIDTYRTRLGIRNVRVRIALGSTASVILDAAREEKAELLALTTHGGSTSSPSPYGSVAQQVVAGVRCPLLMKRTAGVTVPENSRARPSVLWAG